MIDYIYYINLERRKDRDKDFRDYMQAETHRLIRVNAYDGLNKSKDDIVQEAMDNDNLDFSHNWWGTGEIALTYSYMKALKQIAESQKNGLILIDDRPIKNIKLADTLITDIQRNNKNWKACQLMWESWKGHKTKELGMVTEDRESTHPITDFNENLCNGGFGDVDDCYIVWTPKGAKWILSDPTYLYLNIIHITYYIAISTHITPDPEIYCYRYENNPFRVEIGEDPFNWNIQDRLKANQTGHNRKNPNVLILSDLDSITYEYQMQLIGAAQRGAF